MHKYRNNNVIRVNESKLMSTICHHDCIKHNLRHFLTFSYVIIHIGWNRRQINGDRPIFVIPLNRANLLTLDIVTLCT